ncbi:MAG: hypothetical protein QME94_07960 [Anaerolineae bacterium]|nr:hypothetical protein [Anaerolineae bacterium]
MKRPIRLSYLQRLLYRNRLGYRSSELARLCGADQCTISRDLADLESEPFYLPLVQDDEWRWPSMRGHRFTLPPMQVSLQEAAALLARAWGIMNGEEEAEVAGQMRRAAEVYEAVGAKACRSAGDGDPTPA